MIKNRATKDANPHRHRAQHAQLKDINNPSIMSFAVGAVAGAGVLGMTATVRGGVFAKSNNVAKRPATAVGGLGKQALGRRSRASKGGARRGVVMASGEAESQDAYNKAMAEYSKTPFEYRHELGLCTIPPTPPQPSSNATEPKHRLNIPSVSGSSSRLPLSPPDVNTFSLRARDASPPGRHLRIPLTPPEPLVVRV